MKLAFDNAVLLILFLIGFFPHIQDAVPPAPAQSSVQTDTPAAQALIPMPKDPAAILATAAKVNGLSNPLPVPWHLV